MIAKDCFGEHVSKISSSIDDAASHNPSTILDSNRPLPSQPADVFWESNVSATPFFMYDTTRTEHSTPSIPYDSNPSNCAANSTHSESQLYPAQQITSSTINDRLELPPFTPSMSKFRHESLVGCQVSTKQDSAKLAPVRIPKTDISCSSGRTNAYTVGGGQCSSNDQNRKFLPARRKQTPNPIALMARRAEEDAFLCQLRDDRGLCWKYIAAEFHSRTGNFVRIPALQMRRSRFRKRMHGRNSKDLKAHIFAYEYWENQKYNIASQKSVPSL